MATTLNDLINEVRNIKGCKFAHITLYSEEKLPKKVGLGVVTKRVSGQVQINYDYETAINNRLEKQGLPRTFSADKLPWGVWDTPNKVVEHKGEYYLRYYEVKNCPLHTDWFVNGRPMTDTEFKTMCDYKATLSKGSAKQSAEGLNENQVTPRTPKFTNIEEFKCGDIFYQVSQRMAM